MSEKELTCRDCRKEKMCMERSRLIPCTSFKPKEKKNDD